MIGKDLDKQDILDSWLYPYQLSDCEEFNSNHIEDIDETAQVLKEYNSLKANKTAKTCDCKNLKDYIIESRALPIVELGDPIDIENEHYFGHVIFKGEELIKVINRTNPNGKWDFWLLGGRMNDTMIRKTPPILPKRSLWSKWRHKDQFEDLKNSATNCIQYNEIDWIAMKNKAVQVRLQLWQDTIRDSYAALGDINSLKIDLDKIRYEVLNKINDLQKEFFKKNSQAQYQKLKAYIRDNVNYPYRFYIGLLNYVSSSRAYPKIDDWINAAPPLSTYALLDENGWHELEDSESDILEDYEKKLQKWQDFIDQRLKRTKPDDWLAIIDYHC
ncbi:hypothetical protein [Bartonella sp. HY761]|uniref:hypothetical protein n=1 Tax=Bartonella sp. HY761 TaxID=2979330 RepID=UPI0021E255B6|nr:hypothetical protein [Bartonella sp. HY761]UXN08023.1 hypothetical protein N6A79_14695 [Bartonella sp. HY761]